MKQFLSALQCTCRLALAGTLGYTVVGEFFQSQETLVGWFISPRNVGLSTALICALLATVSIWLFFGVRTRVVALAGIMLYLGLSIVQPGLGSSDMETMRSSTLVVLLALPLVVFGGGKISLLRESWRGMVDTYRGKMGSGSDGRVA